MDGKLDSRHGQINALGGLVYLQDTKTNQKFLVDTGAAVSVLPHTSKDPSSGPPLSGADGKAIPSWGSVRKTLNFGIRTFLCTFILAAVSKPILGVNFLSANRLLVDPHFGQVLDATTLDPISGSGSAPRKSGLASLCHVMPEVRALLASFPAIVGDGSGTPNPKHGVFHSIRDNRKTCLRQSKTPRSRKTPDFGKRVSEPGKSRNRPKVQFALVLPSPHGTQAGWLLETMWRLPPAQSCNKT